MPDDFVDVDLDKLLKVAALALEEFKAKEGSVVSLPNDWFWEVDRGSRHSISDGPPTDHTIGSYSDAWEGIESSAADGEIAALDLMLVWLSYIVRELGESRLRD
jgi:hypothetical protein